MSNNETDHTVVKDDKQNYEEVDYVDPESPTATVLSLQKLILKDARRTDREIRDHTVD